MSFKKTLVRVEMQIRSACQSVGLHSELWPFILADIVKLQRERGVSKLTYQYIGKFGHATGSVR